MKVGEDILKEYKEKIKSGNSLSSDKLIETVKNLKNKENEIKQDLICYVNKYSSEIMCSFEDVKTFKQQLSNITSEFSNLQDDIIPFISSKELQYHMKEYESIIDELNMIEKDINLTSQVCKFQENLILFDKNYYNLSNFEETSVNLYEARCLLENNKFTNLIETETLSVLKNEYNERENLLSSFLKGVWVELFEWEYPASAQLDPENIKKIKFHLKPYKTNLTMYKIIQMMQHIGIYKSSLQAFVLEFYNCFFHPILLKNSLKLNINFQTLELNFIYEQDLNITLELVIDNLQQLFEFLKALFHPTITHGKIEHESLTQETRLKIGAILYNKIYSALIENINQRQPNKKDLTSTMTKALEFEQYLELNQFIVKEDLKVSDFLNSKIASHKNNQYSWIFERVRNIILGDNGATIIIPDSTFQDVCQIQNLFDRLKVTDVNIEDIVKMQEKYYSITRLKPVFYINKCKIHQFVEDLLKFMIQLRQDPVFNNKEGIVQCYKTYRDIFELFIALISIQSKDYENNLKYACLFYNGCIYLSNHCAVLIFMFKSELSDSNIICTFSDYLLLLKKTGEDILNKELINQKEALLSHIKEFIGIVKISDPDNDLCITCFNKIHRILFLIKDKTMNVLSNSMYQTIMSSFLNLIYENIYNNITSLEDITENECFFLETNLNLLLQNVCPLLDVDSSNKEQNINLYFPMVQYLERYVGLITIFKSSMQEIVEMYQDNRSSISKISSCDLINLIRAIFQNTEYRSDIIGRIKQRN